jgi:hypothetical protein
MAPSAAQIITANGGPTVFADKVGRTAGAVRVWKHRNQFPREAWPEIIKAVPDLTLEHLMMMEPVRRQASSEQPVA